MGQKYERLLGEDDGDGSGSVTEEAAPQVVDGAGNPPTPQRESAQDGGAGGRGARAGVGDSTSTTEIPVAMPVRGGQTHGQMPVATPVEVGLGGHSGPVRRSNTGDVAGGASDFTMQVFRAPLAAQTSTCFCEVPLWRVPRPSFLFPFFMLFAIFVRL